MNNRIKELILESGLAQYESDNKMKDAEKLAELIVRECMDNLAWHGHDEAVSQLEWFKVNKLGIK